MTLASIPSPDQGTWQLGFFELRAYAICIIVGVLVAVWLGNRRWVARGGQPGTVADIAVWAVPFGLVGARLYHVLSDYQLYFCSTCNPVEALYIWQGGLGIWGAISLGALGAYLACRRRGVKFLALADALAPALAVAQGIGRFGNWFNQELFGRPTTLPWALEIDPQYRPDGYEIAETFHPTFLYEALWDFGVAGLVIWVDRRFRLGHGRALALYVMAYTAGRGWIEYLRIDEANHILGLRLNVWTSILVFLAALGFFIWSARKRPGREVDVEPPRLEGAEEPATAEEAEEIATDEEAAEEEATRAEATEDEATDTEATDNRRRQDTEDAPLPAGTGAASGSSTGASRPRRRWPLRRRR
jgi:prolipoprotein diacylglyceryl transferase